MTMELAIKIGEMAECVKAIWVCGIIVTVCVVVIALSIFIAIITAGVTKEG